MGMLYEYDPADRQVMVPKNTVGYLQVVTDELDGPSCHVCGAIMVKDGDCWKCQSCGATTGVNELPAGEREL